MDLTTIHPLIPAAIAVVAAILAWFARGKPRQKEPSGKVTVVRKDGVTTFIFE